MWVPDPFAVQSAVNQVDHQNAYVERFNRTVRYEWLSRQHREGLDHVQRFVTDWMWADLPNMAFGGFSPKQGLAMAM